MRHGLSVRIKMSSVLTAWTGRMTAHRVPHNAWKLTIWRLLLTKFLGRGRAPYGPLPRPFPNGKGDTLSPHPTPSMPSAPHSSRLRHSSLFPPPRRNPMPSIISQLSGPRTATASVYTAYVYGAQETPLVPKYLYFQKRCVLYFISTQDLRSLRQFSINL